MTENNRSSFKYLSVVYKAKSIVIVDTVVGKEVLWSLPIRRPRKKTL